MATQCNHNRLDILVSYWTHEIIISDDKKFKLLYEKANKLMIDMKLSLNRTIYNPQPLINITINRFNLTYILNKDYSDCSNCDFIVTSFKTIVNILKELSYHMHGISFKAFIFQGFLQMYTDKVQYHSHIPLVYDLSIVMLTREKEFCQVGLNKAISKGLPNEVINYYKNKVKAANELYERRFYMIRFYYFM